MTFFASRDTCGRFMLQGQCASRLIISKDFRANVYVQIVQLGYVDVAVLESWMVLRIIDAMEVLCRCLCSDKD
jgi:hypothetical protein